ncbi:Plexin-B [Araneus ventricosus]|uniref:Plexin-B n=1 Tax=Araneus ventricosus TaxID=182803 RepID=A0A4Y2J3Z1_ARAVE|nr:Plexin-B [Araneus ventricosus]
MGIQKKKQESAIILFNLLGLERFQPLDYIFISLSISLEVIQWDRQTGNGGITVSVKGTNLNAVQYPYMYIIVEGDEFNGNCIVESQIEMKCKSPRIPADKLNFSGNALPIELEYGFKMDKVAQVQNLGSNPRHSKFMMYPDPIYYPFPEKNGIKYFRNDYLTIDGMNLDRASQESDVVVRIGTSYCNVTSLSRSQMTCRPPTTQPPARDINGKPDPTKIPQVVVEVGDHLNFTIGYLCYGLPSCQDHLTKPFNIGGITGRLHSGCVLHPPSHCLPSHIYRETSLSQEHAGTDGHSKVEDGQ